MQHGLVQHEQHHNQQEHGSDILQWGSRKSRRVGRAARDTSDWGHASTLATSGDTAATSVAQPSPSATTRVRGQFSHININFSQHTVRSTHGSRFRRPSLATITRPVITPAEQSLFHELHASMKLANGKVNWSSMLIQFNDRARQQRQERTASGMQMDEDACIYPKQMTHLKQFERQEVQNALNVPLPLPGLQRLTGQQRVAQQADREKRLRVSPQPHTAAALGPGDASASMGVQVSVPNVSAQGMHVQPGVAMQLQGDIPTAMASATLSSISEDARQVNPGGHGTKQMCRQCHRPQIEGGKLSHGGGSGFLKKKLCSHACLVCGKAMSEHTMLCVRPI